MKILSNSDKLRAFIAPNMIDLIKFLDNKGKYAVYIGGDIHRIYHYLEMIGAPTKLITLSQRSHHFSHSYYINNNKAYLQPVIAALFTRKKTICEWCGRIGHKTDAYIIRGPKFLPPSLRRKTNKVNALHGDEPNEPPRGCSRKSPAAHFKSRISPFNTSPMVSAIMGRCNCNSIDNIDVKFHNSDFSV